MRFLLAAAAAGLLIPGSALAADTDLSGAFHDFCVSTAADGKSAIAAARAQGYVSPPPAFAGVFAASVASIQHPAIVWKVSDGALILVVTGRVPFPYLAGRIADVCTAMLVPNVENPDRMLSDAIGGSPVQLAGQHYAAAFSDRGGDRITLDVTNADAMAKAAKAGRVEVIVAGNISGAPMTATTMMMMVSQPQ